MEACKLCKSSKTDDIQYGDFLRGKNMSVHTFCLYLSSNLSQNGADDEGFLGFLEADIKKEESRVSKLSCCYCNKRYANVGCCDRKCRNTFHFICGLENGAENHFCNSYNSYCHKHRRKDYQQRPDSSTVCLICYDNLYEFNGRYSPLQMIQTPCCHNGWFHKLCLQKFAKTAGYFFKCPLCNDAKIFRQKLPAKGIFIPNQDAAWELEPNAFAELLERPSECAAVQCQNKQGRNNTTPSNPLLFCSTCGSTAMHKQCLTFGNRNRFHCADCTAVSMEERDSGRESFNSHANQNDEEHDEIDVCNVSDHENVELIQCLPALCDQDANDCFSDVEIRSTRRLRNRLLSTDSDCSDLVKENQNPSTRNKGTSCSELPKPYSGDEQKPNDVEERDNWITNRRQRRILHTIEDDEVEIIINEEAIKNNQTHSQKSDVQYTGDSEDSTDVEEECTVRRSKYKMTVNDDIQSASPRKQNNAKSHRKRIKERRDVKIEDSCTKSRGKRHSTSSEEEYILKTKTRRVLLKIQSDDEDEVFKQTSKCVGISQNSTKTPGPIETSISIDDDSSDEENLEQSETIVRSERDSVISGATSEDSDEDDDPLENFTKLIEKQKNISCVAQRTRTKSVNLENPRQELNIKPVTSRACTTKKTAVKPKVAISFDSLPQQVSTEQNNMNVSCIAKRTRRRSMCCERSEAISKVECSADQEKPTLDVSCIAIRTRGRRKTVCSETVIEKKKQQQRNERNIETKLMSSESGTSTPTYEKMSEIYETDSETYEDIDNFVVHDDYVEYEKHSNQNEGKLSAFEISCIANRTRKRKSQVIEIESTSSCSSSSSYYSAVSNNQFNYDDKRYNRPAPLKCYNEKWPKQNDQFAFINSNLGRGKMHNQQNYHPSNHLRPHTNNRRRI